MKDNIILKALIALIVIILFAWVILSFSPRSYTPTLTNTATLNFPSTSAGGASDLTITVTGAADGDGVILGVPNASVIALGVYSAWVSSSNTVTVRVTNVNTVSAIDPASGTFRATIIKQ